MVPSAAGVCLRAPHPTGSLNPRLRAYSLFLSFRQYLVHLAVASCTAAQRMHARQQTMTVQSSGRQPGPMVPQGSQQPASPCSGSAVQHMFNAWVRIDTLSAADTLNVIFPVPKPGARPGSLGGLRGIAVGTLPAKLFACILERRFSDWVEASGSRAAGQFGFRQCRRTAQAALVLRMLQDQCRNDREQLWACLVDFRKAYDTVPRTRLWQKLQ